MYGILEDEELNFMESQLLGVGDQFDKMIVKFENAPFTIDLLKLSSRLQWLRTILVLLNDIKSYSNQATKELINCLYLKGLTLEETRERTGLSEKRIRRQHYFLTKEINDVLNLTFHKKRKTNRKSISTEIKQKVFERDNNKCVMCSAEYDLHIHHIKMVSKGGSNNLENLMLLCRKCHAEEHKGQSAYHLLKL